MGCFLGCFGFSSKRKRRNPAHRVQPGEQRRVGSYEPLEAVSANLDFSEDEPRSSSSELSKKKSKETLNCKIRKKVSFNLNVQTYEPIPDEENADHFWESDEEKEAKKQQTPSGGNQNADRVASYPSNYRYRNCIDEEDDIGYEESDLEEEYETDDYDEDEDYGGANDARISLEEFSQQFNPVSSQETASWNQLSEDRISNGSNEEGLKMIGINQNALLKPVENLSQWKAVKARGMPPRKQQRKENVAVEQLQPQESFSSKLRISQSMTQKQEIAVDASLSNWLVGLDSGQPFTAFQTSSSKKSFFDRSYPWRNEEDMPVLDITNLQA